MCTKYGCALYMGKYGIYWHPSIIPYLSETPFLEETADPLSGAGKVWDSLELLLPESKKMFKQEYKYVRKKWHFYCSNL